MRDVLDPADIWIGTPQGAQIFGNKRPVAVDDTLTVEKDSGAITVNVLANDFDPENGALTLVSAVAALGTAVAEANNTVTYTPPIGISGFDTVVYEIADDQNQRTTGQINVTILDTALSITVQSDNTMWVATGDGAFTVTVTAPAEFAGTYEAQAADLATGPVNLVAPILSGTLAVGQTLSAGDGLWIYDTTAGAPVQSWQWQRAGTDIAGAVTDTYVLQAADVGFDIAVVEAMSDAFGTRTATSAAVNTGFLPSNDTALLGWWDANDTSTITDTAGAVSSWADKAGGPALSPTSSPQIPTTGLRNLNGLNVLDFNGNSHLQANRTFPSSGDVAFHMALEIDSVASLFEAVLAVEAGNDFQIDANSTSQFDGRLNPAGIGSAVNLTGGPFSGPQILSVVLDQTGTATIDVFLGNVLRASTGYTAVLDANAALHIMANRSKNAWATGSVAELVITGDISNRLQYHNYLSAKWGIS
ncbi:MAG: Ig-like domain-containing protein [Paracoccaceae bacterium]|nr:Ig-like domain-containing protein [Paracoccaceae bacterium]